MTDDAVIATQARQIAELSEEVTRLKACHHQAVLHIIRIGGPLNDNAMQCTDEQLRVFQSILNELK